MTNELLMRFGTGWCCWSYAFVLSLGHFRPLSPAIKSGRGTAAVQDASRGWDCVDSDRFWTAAVPLPLCLGRDKVAEQFSNRTPLETAIRFSIALPIRKRVSEPPPNGCDDERLRRRCLWVRRLDRTAKLCSLQLYL